MVDHTYGSVEVGDLPRSVSEERDDADLVLSHRRWGTMLLLFLSAIAALFVISASTGSNPVTTSMINEEASLLYTDPSEEIPTSSKQLPSPTPSSYFDVLPWQRVEDESDGSMYYVGFLEFCSIGEKVFFYRAVSSANSSVPCENATSTVSPLIRMLPRTHYKLILINRSHQPTNIHTHGLHVPGVGIVDDVSIPQQNLCGCTRYGPHHGNW
jgi:hypothetical protein